MKTPGVGTQETLEVALRLPAHLGWRHVERRPSALQGRGLWVGQVGFGGLCVPGIPSFMMLHE